MLKKLSKGKCRGRESTGNPHARACELTNHFTQRGVFATYFVYISHAQFFKPRHIFLCHRSKLIMF